MKHILKQIRKTEEACNKADIECQELARLIAPYIHEDLRKDISVFNQKGDGLVMDWDDSNYPIRDVIEAINKGARDIDMRNIHKCPIKPI